MKSWASADFSAAFQWASQLDGPAERDSAMGVIAGAVMELAESRQRDFINAVGVTDKNALAVLRHLDPAAALQTFATLTPAQQSAAWGVLQLQDSSASATERAAYLGHMLRAKPDCDYAYQTASVAAQWVQQDSAAAAIWVESLPDGEPRLWAAANLVTNWARHDAAAATTWLAGLPEGPTKTQAREQLASTLTR